MIQTDFELVKRKKKIGNQAVKVHCLWFESSDLNRQIKVELYLPLNFKKRRRIAYPTLLLNDGQDADQLQLAGSLRRHNLSNPRMAVVAIHADERRMNEYGTIGVPDYQGRGDLAQAHARMVLQLLNYLQREYGLCQERHQTYYAGFSLGGLSALDFSWTFPQYISRIGVFSGSLWWRSEAYSIEHPDGHRIMHEKVRTLRGDRPNLAFWFQTGTEDETADRNNNGIIDSIDDTLDLIKELKSVGYHQNRITYLEIKGGKHDFETWSKIFPQFLGWCVS